MIDWRAHADYRHADSFAWSCTGLFRFYDCYYYFRRVFFAAKAGDMIKTLVCSILNNGY